MNVTPVIGQRWLWSLHGSISIIEILRIHNDRVDFVYVQIFHSYYEEDFVGCQSNLSSVAFTGRSLTYLPGQDRVS